MTEIMVAPKPRYRVQAGRSVGGLPSVVEKGGVYLPVSGGWLSTEAAGSWNWWQQGYDIEASGARSAIIEACISAYAQTIAMCPGAHWKTKEDGGRERIKTSPLARIIKSPNMYQTMSDFLLNGVSHLYEDGNMFALAIRDDRFNVVELHLMQPRQCSIHVGPEGDVFYGLNGNPVIDRMLDYPAMVPARDVLHIRLRTSDYHSLRGESPIIAAARDIAASNAMSAQQLAFYMNQSRPSTVLSTDMTLDATQVELLRQRWNEQTKGLNAGGTPILTAGLKPTAMPSISANDSQLADVMKMTDQRIALAYRVPMQILGIGGTNFTTTEALMQSWLASSLGFALNHIESSFDSFFGLKGQPDEYLEFDTTALLRSAFKERIEGIVRAVQGGVFSINEGRNLEGYPEVKFGDEPRVQQQLVPLSAAAAIPAPGTTPPGTTPPAPRPNAAPPAASIPTPTDDESDDEEKSASDLLIEKIQAKQRSISFKRNP